jgi:hypothetical protein
MAGHRDQNWVREASNHFLWARVQGLQYELRQRDLRLAEKDRYIAQLEQQISELKQQAAPAAPVPTLPAFVKPPTRKRRRKRPGREAGHPVALREMPKKIDRHQTVPLPKDRQKKPICPRCRTRLAQLRKHRRIVEDLIQATVETTCYHTQSGHCPRCRSRIESRDSQQPPAANVPHGQLGINALMTAAILRVRHRLPFRQVAQVLKDLPGLSISAAGLVKQIKRLARWLDVKYQDLILRMRASPHVHVDESRGGKVPLKLLGKAFDGVVVSDFYGAYNRLPGPKQRCLVHLLREVKETSAADKAFGATSFARRLRRWCKAALELTNLAPKLKTAEYRAQTDPLENRLQKIIDLDDPHPDAQRLTKRHRQELTRFLYDKHLEGTNNRAERALRPAVVMRKITGGNRSPSGAQAWAKLASLMATADHQKLGVYDATKKLITEYWDTMRR